MINLLPPDVKRSYWYAHRNVGLLRWIIALGIGLAGLAAISTAGLIYIRQQAQGYTGQIAAAEASLKQQNLSATQKQVKDITGSLKLAVQVLSKEVLFSKLLNQLATVTPSNAVLTDLTIAQAQSAVTITATTTDYNAATQLQINLADPANRIFAQADIISIACNATPVSGVVPHYPCTVIIRALFASNNPFLFVNDGAQ